MTMQKIPCKNVSVGWRFGNFYAVPVARPILRYTRKPQFAPPSTRLPKPSTWGDSPMPTWSSSPRSPHASPPQLQTAKPS